MDEWPRAEHPPLRLDGYVLLNDDAQLNLLVHKSAFRAVVKRIKRGSI